MNNKGFAITSIIYGLMLLFVVVLTSFISVLVGRNRRTDELIESVYDTLVNEEIIVNDYDFINNDNTYTTLKQGLYNFEDNNCLVYLPKSVVLILEDNKLLYKVNGSTNINEFKEIECIK